MVSDIRIVCVGADGRQSVAKVPSGVSLLEAAHRNAWPLEGACGGKLACATCHVMIDKDWCPALPLMREGEQDMLDCAEVPITRYSRLACQILLSPVLDGLVFHLPG